MSTFEELHEMYGGDPSTLVERISGCHDDCDEETHPEYKYGEIQIEGVMFFYIFFKEYKLFILDEISEGLTFGLNEGVLEVEWNEFNIKTDGEDDVIDIKVLSETPLSILSEINNFKPE